MDRVERADRERAGAGDGGDLTDEQPPRRSIAEALRASVDDLLVVAGAAGITWSTWTVDPRLSVGLLSVAVVLIGINR